jgi:hypothetical protein
MTFHDEGDITSDVAKTDGQMAIPLAPGIALSSAVYTATDSSNVLIVTRTAGNRTDYYKVPIAVAHRTTALKGIKLKSVAVSYTLAGSNTTDDDLEIHIVKQTLPSDESGATGAVLAGDADADYDTEHATKAARLDATANPELHTATVTIPTGEQAYLATGEQLWLRVKCKDNAGADLALVLTGAVANFDIAAL